MEKFQCGLGFHNGYQIDPNEKVHCWSGLKDHGTLFSTPPYHTKTLWIIKCFVLPFICSSDWMSAISHTVRFNQVIGPITKLITWLNCYVSYHHHLHHLMNWGYQGRIFTTTATDPQDPGLGCLNWTTIREGEELDHHWSTADLTHLLHPHCSQQALHLHQSICHPGAPRPVTQVQWDWSSINKGFFFLKCQRWSMTKIEWARKKMWTWGCTVLT